MKFSPQPVFCNKIISITYTVHTKKTRAKISHHAQFSVTEISFTYICYFMASVVSRYNGDSSDCLRGQLIGLNPKQKN